MNVAVGSSRVLVTGASGFVGRAVVAALASKSRPVRAALRRTLSAGALPFAPAVQAVQVGEMTPTTDWRTTVAGMDSIVHCAARVHVMQEKAIDPLAEFRRVNVDGTLNLARQAAQAGVRRFVFISSIGVNGSQTFDQPFTCDAVPAPHSPYAQAKLEAEVALRQLALDTGLEVAIIRPPLVFGPGAPGNFDRLIRALYRGLILPLGAVHNRRSLVSLGNLVSLIDTCIDHPAAANQTFLVSDGEDISTTALLQRLAHAIGKPARLVPVPVSLLTGAGRLLGKAQLLQQLCGSLQVDIFKTRSLLGWEPPVRLGNALNATAQAFLARTAS